MLPTVAQLDHAGRAAFNALRDFQVEELRAYKAQGRWPAMDVHRDILAKLAVARDCIDDSLVYGADLVPGRPVPAQVRSMLDAQAGVIAALNGLVGPLAPSKARDLMNTFQRKFAALFDLFPPAGREPEPDHPPRP